MLRKKHTLAGCCVLLHRHALVSHRHALGSGNAAYYVPYMEALYDGFSGRASVRGVSNLGQCSRGLAGQVPASTCGNLSNSFDECHWTCDQRVSAPACERC